MPIASNSQLCQSTLNDQVDADLKAFLCLKMNSLRNDYSLILDDRNLAVKRKATKKYKNLTFENYRLT